MATDWKEIEQAARDQARQELDVAERTPLEFGQHIAWATSLYGRTDGFSPIHRVGFPRGSDPYTTCGEVIPAPVLWFPLNPVLIRRMKSCRFCDAEYARATQESAA